LQGAAEHTAGIRIIAVMIPMLASDDKNLLRTAAAGNCREFRHYQSSSSWASGLLLGAYTHAVEEDDRRVAEQLGEMLCPNVANLAQEKTFAESGVELSLNCVTFLHR
jgi:hypothetical protein